MSDARSPATRSARVGQQEFPPFVVHVGFAGARDLFKGSDVDGTAERERLLGQLAQQFRAALEELPGLCALTNRHVLVGISQIAIGADALFADACSDFGMPHRFFLPQTLDVFLDATSDAGMPDFDPTERALAAQFAQRANVIEVRCVSDQPVRGDRFDEANARIVAEADVLVCLLPHEHGARQGGTTSFRDRALAARKPCLELRYGFESGECELTRTWHMPSSKDARGDSVPAWTPPVIPQAMGGPASARTADRGIAATAKRYDLFGNALADIERLQALSGERARQTQSRFKSYAMLIVALHVLATTLAGFLTASSFANATIEPALLGVELLLLIAGFAFHVQLHRTEANQHWAHARVLAEVGSSARALAAGGVEMWRLADIAFPRELRAVLGSLFVIQAIAARANQQPLAVRRADYVTHRLVGAPSKVGDSRAQIPYYEQQRTKARRSVRAATNAFRFFSMAAMVAVLAKLLLSQSDSALLLGGIDPSALATTLAIALPVVAVGFLSALGALDWQARAVTFDEALDRLYELQPRVAGANTEWEFAQCALEAERELLNESANWAARRAFTAVS